MATISELRARIDRRLDEVRQEAERLERALDALNPAAGGRRSQRDTLLPNAKEPSAGAEPERGRVPTAREVDGAQVGDGGATERAVQALRAELAAGLRTRART